MRSRLAAVGRTGRRDLRLVGLLAAVLWALLAAAPACAGTSPRDNKMPWLVASSEAVNVSVNAAEIEPVHTIDGTPLYRMRFDLAGQKEPLTGVLVEYEISDSRGTVLGGGSFTVRPDMIDRQSGDVTVLAGFAGIEVKPELVVRARFVEEPMPKQFVDTCTTFCDHCSDKAEAVCTNGVNTLDCNCSDSFRQCKYTCVVKQV